MESGLKLARLLSQLGYGSRREVTHLLQRRRVRGPDGAPLGPDAADPGGPLWVDGEPLDPRPPLTLLLHKPADRVCTRTDGEGPTVYEELPPRYALRRPALAPVGRLDRDTTGLLLLTDDGALLHRLTSPRHAVPKVYRAALARPLRGDEGEVLASGTLLLRGEERPCRPAALEVLAPAEVRITVTEGRYHLVRRMLAALGNHVLALHREQVGGLSLGELPAGGWRALGPDDLARLEAPGSERVS